MTDLTELRRLAEAAPPGEWRACGANDGQCTCGLVWSVPLDIPIATTAMADNLMEPAQAVAARDYIAAANPATVLTLLDRIETLEAQLEDKPPPADAVLLAKANRALHEECVALRRETTGYVWLLVEEDEVGEKDTISAHLTFQGALAAAFWRWSELGEALGGDSITEGEQGWTLEDGTGVLIHRFCLEA